MKRAFFGVAALAVAGGTGLSITAWRHVDTIQTNVRVGTVSVGGLTPEEAAFRLRTWWEARKLEPLRFHSDKLQTKIPAMKPSELGVALDDRASVSQLPLQGFIDGASEKLTGNQPEEKVFDVVYKSTGTQPTKLLTAVRAAIGKPRPARVVFVKGNIIQKPEQASLAVDKEALQPAILASLQSGEPVEVPLKEADKRVPDEELKTIRDVVSEFTTRFSAGNRPRASNIRLAASKINGVVIAPGDQFSFNSTVGQRTLRAGFRLAGVYVNGQHDVGVGGGICQVSTTLYNAALFANLPVLKRSNHSLPVPYVPLGRDATVNWGAQDLVLQNDTDGPIALSATYEPGKLTFRVLGQKEPGLQVKVERGGLSAWGGGTRTIVDPKLPPGARRVIQSGSTGYSCSTWRLVYKDGKLLKKEPLGRSAYTGASRVIAVGPARPKPIAATPPSDPGMDAIPSGG